MLAAAGRLVRDSAFRSVSKSVSTRYNIAQREILIRKIIIEICSWEQCTRLVRQGILVRHSSKLT